MACPNFKNGPKNGLGPLGVKHFQRWEALPIHCLPILPKHLQ
jgi:hypothetical protein